MIFIAGSICCGAFLILFFKVVERWGIPNLQAIIINYMACVVCGVLLTQDRMPVAEVMRTPWFGWACVLGICFIVGFNLIGLTVQKAGVTPASVASKLSMIISVPFTIWLFGDAVTGIKIIGLLLAVAAVIFSSVKQGDSFESASKHLILPLMVLAISGVIEIIVSYNQKNNLPAAYFPFFLTVAFGTAAALGSLYYLYTRLKWKIARHPRAILAGILLGVPNYFSLFFFLKAFETTGWPASIILPVTNIGVLIVSTIFGWLIFRDKLSSLNIFGLCISLIAITLLSQAS